MLQFEWTLKTFAKWKEARQKKSYIVLFIAFIANVENRQWIWDLKQISDYQEQGVGKWGNVSYKGFLGGGNYMF